MSPTLFEQHVCFLISRRLLGTSECETVPTSSLSQKTSKPNRVRIRGFGKFDRTYVFTAKGSPSPSSSSAVSGSSLTKSHSLSTSLKKKENLQWSYITFKEKGRKKERKKRGERDARRKVERKVWMVKARGELRKEKGKERGEREGGEKRGREARKEVELGTKRRTMAGERMEEGREGIRKEGRGRKEGGK